jgi:hypothetical protein
MERSGCKQQVQTVIKFDEIFHNMERLMDKLRVSHSGSLVSQHREENEECNLLSNRTSV